jgi:hypothetical protein
LVQVLPPPVLFWQVVEQVLVVLCAIASAIPAAITATAANANNRSLMVPLPAALP